MNADIRLNDTQAIIEAWDLELRAADRQGGHPGDHRRALVHDRGDRLTVNWGHDYQGGVNLIGVKTISAYDPPGEFIVTESRHRLDIQGNVVVDGTVEAKVRVNWSPVDLDAGWLEANSVFLPGPSTEADVLLGGMLSQHTAILVALMERVRELEETLTALEGRVSAVEDA